MQNLGCTFSPVHKALKFSQVLRHYSTGNVRNQRCRRRRRLPLRRCLLGHIGGIEPDDDPSGRGASHGDIKEDLLGDRSLIVACLHGSDEL